MCGCIFQKEKQNSIDKIQLHNDEQIVRIYVYHIEAYPKPEVAIHSESSVRDTSHLKNNKNIHNLHFLRRADANKTLKLHRWISDTRDKYTIFVTNYIRVIIQCNKSIYMEPIGVFGKPIELSQIKKIPKTLPDIIDTDNFESVASFVGNYITIKPQIFDSLHGTIIDRIDAQL